MKCIHPNTNARTNSVKCANILELVLENIRHYKMSSKNFGQKTLENVKVICVSIRSGFEEVFAAIKGWWNNLKQDEQNVIIIIFAESLLAIEK